MLQTIRKFAGAGFLKNLGLYSISPEKDALSLTVGFYLGIFPVAGTTTLLCLAAIAVLRLNSILTITLNWLVYPLQIILIYPFLKAGRILFYHNKKVLPDVSLKQWLNAESWENFYHLGESVMGAIAVWASVSIITGFILYRLFLKITISVSHNYNVK